MVDNVNVNVTYPVRNADGVLQYYGLSEDMVDRGQYVNTLTGEGHLLEFNVGFADAALGTDATHNFVLSYNAFIPKGAYVTRCEFETTVAWDSASSNVALNFGTIKQSDYAIVDADGLMDSIAKTVVDLAGNLVVTQAAGSYPDITTYAGAILGVIRSQNELVTCFWETNAPTAGAGILRVYYRHGLTV